MVSRAKNVQDLKLHPTTASLSNIASLQGQTFRLSKPDLIEQAATDLHQACQLKQKRLQDNDIRHNV